MDHAATADGPVWAARALADADHRLSACSAVLESQAALGPCGLLDDRTIALVRGMAADLAAQLSGSDHALTAAVRAMLVAHRAMLMHLHAIAVEFRLSEALAARRALDPVFPPLVRRHPDGGALLAAQTRVTDAVRLMRMPLAELPGDLQHIAWSIRDAACADAHGSPPNGRTPVRADPPGRIALLQRALLHMADDLALTLHIDEAGVALFLSALALASGMPREMVALATAEDDPLRLALMLRTAGLGRDSAALQLLAIRPDADPALVDIADAERLLRDSLG